MTKKALLFIGLTFAVSWSVFALFLSLGGEYGSATSQYVLLGYMFIPMVMAVVVCRIYRDPIRSLGVSFRPNRWFVVAWLSPLAVVLLSFAVSLLIPGVSYAPDMAQYIDMLRDVMDPESLAVIEQTVAQAPGRALLMAVVQGLVAGATVNAIAGFGEELGWRGLLQKELSQLGFWRASLVTGVVWGLWHAPVCCGATTTRNTPSPVC